ncbi:UNVERIFIED_CONTAM: hypothetical protein HDU68_002626 [Siphonaria sp. JEL0065]|nr:hypothetical protein HDU68_002626 [Siphonaria sp. JEL0065]
MLDPVVGLLVDATVVIATVKLDANEFPQMCHSIDESCFSWALFHEPSDEEPSDEDFSETELDFYWLGNQLADIAATGKQYHEKSGDQMLELIAKLAVLDALNPLKATNSTSFEVMLNKDGLWVSAVKSPLATRVIPYEKIVESLQVYYFEPSTYEPLQDDGLPRKVVETFFIQDPGNGYYLDESRAQKLHAVTSARDYLEKDEKGRLDVGLLGFGRRLVVSDTLGHGVGYGPFGVLKLSKAKVAVNDILPLYEYELTEEEGHYSHLHALQWKGIVIDTEVGWNIVRGVCASDV